MKNAIKLGVIANIVGFVLFSAVLISMLLLEGEENELIIFAIGAVGAVMVLVGIIVIFMGVDVKIRKRPEPEPIVQPSPPPVVVSTSPPVPAPEPTPVVQQRTVEAETPEQQDINRVRCPGCSTVFSYTKDIKGLTRVRCPSCGKEGIIR